MNIVDQNSKQIKNICKKHKVDQLYVFGSVLTPNFTEESDIDFLVKFGDIDLYDYFDNLINLKEILETLLERKVDILEEQALKNPYLKNQSTIAKC